jgi:hypothetical protein
LIPIAFNYTDHPCTTDPRQPKDADSPELVKGRPPWSSMLPSSYADHPGTTHTVPTPSTPFMVGLIPTSPKATDAHDAGTRIKMFMDNAAPSYSCRILV